MLRFAAIPLLLAMISPAIGAEPAPAPTPAPTYAQIHSHFIRHCIACHNTVDPEAGFVLASHADLLKGGDTGPAIVPGKADESLLIQLIEHTAKPVMPPVKKGDKLAAHEIAQIRAWINAGAPGPRPGEVLLAAVPRPNIAPAVPPRQSIHALAYSPQLKRLAIARPGQVQVMSIDDRTILHTLTGHRGKVNDLAISADGTILAAGAGLPGELGEVRLWNLKDGRLIRIIEGHRDAVYAVALSPNGSLVATGSYDQKIMLWSTAAPTATNIAVHLRTLDGHNGAIFDLAFRPDGNVLASVSADRTLKLWHVATGDRLDTRNESMQALHAVAFSPKGDRLFAAGVDNRIRVWSIGGDAKEGGNTLLTSRFAHEGAILTLAISPDGDTLISAADDRTVKLWNARDLSPRLALEKQADWPAAIVALLDGKALAVGNLAGGLTIHDATSGAVLPPPKPELVISAIPTGIERGGPREIQITGKHLIHADQVRSSDPRIKGTVRSEAASGLSAIVTIDTSADLPPGTYEIWLANAGGESAKMKLLIDDLPQVSEAEPNDLPAAATLLPLPASAWGVISHRGDTDHFAFDGLADQLIVIDALCARIGGKANLIVTLSDPAGRIIASNNDHDGSPDSFIAARLTTAGRHTVAVRDLQMTGSPDHRYRLSIGELPMVTGHHPLIAAENTPTTIELIGFNLPADAHVKLPASPGGEVALPLAPNHRTRRPLKVTLTPLPTFLEREPNDTPADLAEFAVATTTAATPTTPTTPPTTLPIPAIVTGRIDRPAIGNQPGDADLFRFTATKGQRLILETNAARLGSPIDTRIEILHADGPRAGQPVIRTRLRAVRDTAHTFRPIDANANGTRLVNWEEMQQNEYLYMQGEVVKLFLPPRGPDSQWDFYTLAGKRRCYFDTTATAHALDEPCYIVEPLAPDAPTPPSNGLPIFTIPYANDDDQERQLGSDSRINFTAPAAGAYLARITDARGFGGPAFVYTMTIRQAQPDYRVVILGANPTVPIGSGVAFTAVATRIDGYDGPITLDITGLPPGFIASTPLVIEAGHNEAKGALFALPDAPAPTADNQAKTQIKSRATVDGKEIIKDVNNLGVIKLGPKPKLLASLTPEPMTVAVESADAPVNATAVKAATVSDTPAAAATPAATRASAATETTPLEITIAPGTTATARIKLDRNGHTDLASFDLENLPHGVIVADLGLNGLLIRADENERVIFITCAPWVQEMDRLCFARCQQAGNPTSKPVMLKVRRK